jgi:PAS domain S-box-containing protein
MTKPRKDGNLSQTHRQASHVSQRGPGAQLAALRAKLAESRGIISRYRAKEKALLKEQEAQLSILENAPCGIGISQKIYGKVLYLNAEFIQMFGYTIDDIPTVRDWLSKAYPDRKYRRFLDRRFVGLIANTTGSISGVVSVTCKDGTIKQVEVITSILPNGNTVNMFLDVTRRAEIEAALRESETKFRLLFERSNDAIFLLDGNRFIDCNETAVRILRASSKKEVLSKDPLELSPVRQPDGELSSVKGKEMVDLALREGVSHFEWVHKRFDGTLFPVEVVLTLIPLQGKEILYTSWRDITKRKEAEAKAEQAREELEQRVQERTAELNESRENLRRLSEYLQTAREEERTRIAQEIHDELGMGISTTKMNLSWVSSRIPLEFRDLINETKVIAERLDGILHSIRKICSDLRPAVLDHFGLGAAIEWQVSEFQRRTGITCTCTVENTNPDMNQELSSALFRILQEALTNILRHACATEIEVGLRKANGKISLTVGDNGAGITPDQISKTDSFGLMGMRERVRYWRGDMSIKGISGKGTVLCVFIPLNGDAQMKTEKSKTSW